MKQAPGRRTRVENRRNVANRRRYVSARWKRVRAYVIARDRGLCQECKRQGRLTEGQEVDHIQKAEEYAELFYKVENLQLLCKSCHSKKTIRGG